MAKPKKNENIKWIWGAQPASWGGLGPQGFAVQMALADVLFFGGSRGGGKSDATIGRHLIKAEKYGPHHNVLIIRRKYKDFGELRRRIRELIADGLPAELVGGDNQPNTWRFTGECYKGAVVQLIAVRFPEQLSDFEGWQNKQFLGSGEFALTFGDFEVNITVPSDHIIGATGFLQNPKEVLN